MNLLDAVLWLIACLTCGSVISEQLTHNGLRIVSDRRLIAKSSPATSLPADLRSSDTSKCALTTLTNHIDLRYKPFNKVGFSLEQY